MPETSESRIAARLQSLPEVDEYVASGTLREWYVVAVFDLPDDRKCLTRYSPEAQPTWTDLGLLEFARASLKDEYFDDSDDDTAG
jgi:hypothetical protein